MSLRYKELLRGAWLLCAIIAALLFSACAMQSGTAQSAEPAQAPAAPLPSPVPTPTVDPQTLCALPDLQYETEAYALRSLRTRGAMAVVEYEETDALPAGLVTAQSINAGSCAKEGEPVKLVVSKAVVPTPSPTPEPTPKPTRKPRPTEEVFIEMPVVPEVPFDPQFPTVTPQPTQDPQLSEFLNFQAEPAAPCG